VAKTKSNRYSSLNNSLLVSGFVLGVAGAVLDFYSGSTFLSLSMSTTTMMGVTTTHYNTIAQDWGIFLLGLGGVLAITAVLNATSLGMKQMKLFGGLMMSYGVVMLVVGALMYSGVTPVMAQQFTTLISGFGMFGMGVLMVVNGVFMARVNPSGPSMMKM
jgi:hypothetical protein